MDEVLNNEFKKIEQANTLWNAKLDQNELNFLKWQKELSINLNSWTGKQLRDDIRDANKLQIQKDVKLNELLNGYIIPENFEKMLKNLMPKINMNFGSVWAIQKNASFFGKILWKFNDISKKHSWDATWFWPKMFVIRFLLDVHNKKVRVWYEDKPTPIYDWEFVKMLHKFQTETQAGVEGRSAVDCIVWQRTIQQLASYTGVWTVAGNVEIGREFTVSAEVEKKESYTLDEAKKRIEDIEKNVQIHPTQKVNDILNVYNALTPAQKAGSGIFKVKIMGKEYAQKYLVKDRIKEKIVKLIDQYEMDMSLLNNELLKKLFDIDLKENKEKQEINQEKINMAISISNVWMTYYLSESPRANKKLSTYMNQWIKSLETLQNSNPSGNIDEKIKRSLMLIFWPTDFNYRSTKQQETLINSRVSWKFNSYIKTEDGALVNSQDSIFEKIVKSLVDNDCWDDAWILKLRNDLLDNIRLIDKSYDWFILDDYKSWDAIIEEIESYSGTSQSIMNKRIEENWTDLDNKEYKKYNNDIGKVDVFFNKLIALNDDGKPEYPDIVSSFETIFSEMDKGNINIVHHDSTTTTTWELTIRNADAWDELKLPSNVSKAVMECFGFWIPQIAWWKLINDYKKIKNQFDKQKVSILEDVKKEYKQQRINIESDIKYYDSMVTQFPDDPKVNDRRILSKGLTEQKKNLTNENDIGYNTPLDPNNSITVNKIIEWQKRIYFAKIFENTLVYTLMLRNKGAIEKMQKKQNKTENEKMIDRYTDIMWVWSYMSDKTFNNIIYITKEVIVQVVICAVSMWIGNLVAKWVIAWTKRALNTVKLTNASTKLGKFAKLWMWPIMSNLSKIDRAARIWTMTTKTAVKTWIATIASWSWRIAVAGSSFHLTSTMLNNLYSWQDLRSGVNPLWYTEYVDEDWNVKRHNNWEWYLQSIAFFGVLEIVSPGIQNLLKRAKWDPKKIDAIMNNVMKKKVSTKQFVIDFAKNSGNSALSMTWELASLMVTETLLSVTFGHGLPDFDAESIIHMIGMIVWLRMTHGIKLWLEGKMDNYIIKEVKGKNGKKATDLWSIDWITIEFSKNGKTYEAVLNSKWEVVRSTDPNLRIWMEVKVNEYWSRSKIPDRSPANRNQTADYIAKNRYENGKSNANEGVPTEVQIRTWEKVKIDHNGKYKDIIDQYKKLIKEKPQWYEKSLSQLDVQLAERITLDRWRSIEYKSEADARSSFEQLSKMKEYDSMLRTYKNFEWKWCVEKINSNTIMPNIYISVKWMEWHYTWVTIKNKSFEIPIKNLKTWDQIFSEFGWKRYEFAKKENGNWEVISEWGRFEKWNEVKLSKNKDWTMTFERIWDAKKIEVSEVWLKRFASNQSEIVIKDVIDFKQIEKFVEKFDAQIMSDKWITIDGKNYKMVYEPNMTQNKNRNWVWKFIVDWKVTSVKSENGKVLPENSDGNRIREKYYEARNQYLTMKESDMKIVVEQSQSIQDKLRKRKGVQNVKDNSEIKKTEPETQTESKNEVKVEVKTEKPEVKQEVEVKEEPKAKYIDKPLKENFTQQERLQYKNELLSKIKERYPDWYKEVIDQWYKFEHFKEPQWGETSAIEKTIYINPRMMWRQIPWSKARGAEIPIEATFHEMSHVITEKNLNLELLAEARINDGTYVNFLEIANKKQLLFIELANIYERTKQTFSPHAMSEIYTKAVNKEGISVGEILPVREDMVELHAKYRRWELETFLNERAPQMWVTKEQVNDILKSFEDAFWSKNSASKVNPEVNVPTRKIPSIDWYNRPWNKTKIEPIEWETLDATVQRALNDKRINKLVVVENWEVFMVNPKITTSKNIEVRFPDGRVETGSRKNGKLEGENCERLITDGIALGLWNNSFTEVIKQSWTFIEWELTWKNGIITKTNKRDGITTMTEILNWEFNNGILINWKKSLEIIDFSKKIYEGAFRDWKLWEGKITENWVNYEVKDWFKILELYDQWIWYSVRNEAVALEYGNTPIDINLSADCWLQLVRIKDYPELVNNYNLNPNIDYFLVDWNLFRTTNWTRWFKALRNGEVVTLWREGVDRFDFSNDLNVSRKHLTISRTWDRIQITDHSTNGTRIERDVMSAQKSENNIINLDQSVQNYIDGLWRTDIRMQSKVKNVVEKYPDVSVSYLKNEFFIDLVNNGLRNVSPLPRFDFSKPCAFSEWMNGRDYIKNGEILSGDMEMMNILENSFTYKNSNGHYCTAAIPTFMESILSGKWIKFIDATGNIYYTKINADVQTSLKVEPGNNGKIVFGWVSDMVHKVGSFVKNQDAKWISIKDINNSLQEMWLEYIVNKGNNGLLEITSVKNIKFEIVNGGELYSNFFDFWWTEGMEWNLYKDFTEVVRNMNDINMNWMDYNGVIDFFKRVQKVTENQQFSYGRNNYSLNNDVNFNLANIDYNYVINILENPLNSQKIREIIRNNSQSTTIDQLYKIVEYYNGLVSQTNLRIAS